jgi:hypothetical protein
MYKVLEGVISDVEEVSTDEFTAAIESLMETTGLLTGTPLPYMVQAERAIRTGTPLQLLFPPGAVKAKSKERNYPRMGE